jgi:DNA-binding MarR family transcriptional regulator
VVFATDPWQLDTLTGHMARAEISLLFDFFVTAQRLRRVLADGMAESGLRPDEYAVYSLLFEREPLTATQMAEYLGMPLTTVLDYIKSMTAAGHVVRTAHPFDGRATELSLSRAGARAHRRANAHWEVVRKQIEENLSIPIADVRRALHALDDAADSTRLAPKLRRAAPGKTLLSRNTRN